MERWFSNTEYIGYIYLRVLLVVYAFSYVYNVLSPCFIVTERRRHSYRLHRCRNDYTVINLRLVFMFMTVCVFILPNVNNCIHISSGSAVVPVPYAKCRSFLEAEKAVVPCISGYFWITHWTPFNRIADNTMCRLLESTILAGTELVPLLVVLKRAP